MGRIRRSRTHSNPKKNQAPGQKTKRYKRDLDQIKLDLLDQGVTKLQDELGRKDIEDMPGGAEFGCLSCARYFASPIALETHQRGKPHKRRLKRLEEEVYTIEESRRAVGVGVDNGESLRAVREREKEGSLKEEDETVMSV